MIRKYIYGTPFETEAVVTDIAQTDGTPAYGVIDTQDGFYFTYIMDEDDIVYGMGEANRGINKRGYCYISDCTDDPNTQKTNVLCTAHTTSSSLPERKVSDSSLTIRQSSHLTSAIPAWTR